MSTILAEPAPVRPIYAWFVLLFVLAVVSYTDRYVLTLLIDPIKQQFSISDVEISILLGLSFTLIYGVFGIIMGYAADRLNRRNIIFAGVILWSLATLGCGLAHDFVQLFLARLLVGAGEAVLTPAATTGGLKVDNTTLVGGVESCALHFTFNFDTLFLLRVVSPRFQPVRS